MHFKKPKDEIMFKYTLSDEQILIDRKEQRAYSHIHLMEHVTRTKIDELIQNLREPGVFPEHNTLELNISTQ